MGKNKVIQSLLQGLKSKNHFIFILLICLILFFIISCIFVKVFIYDKTVNSEPEPMFYGFSSNNATYVSIINLISNPEDYNGKLVRVIGVIDIIPEGKESSSVIYLTKDDYKYLITKNALFIRFNYNALMATDEELADFTGKYVLIEGVFCNAMGTWGLYSGEIENVTRIRYIEKGL